MTAGAPTGVPSHEGIVTFDDWMKIELRVAKIVEVEDIEGADKLLNVNLGKNYSERHK